MACSTTTLPAVSPVSLIDWSIGTPAETDPEKVRDQRASATFWITSPILKGTRSRKRSHDSLPRGVFFHLKNANAPSTHAGKITNQYPVTASDAVTQSWVGSGRPPSSAGFS